MALAWLLSTQWLLASVGSVAVGVLAWLLLNGAAQAWPALRMRRNVWLAAQCIVAVAALLPFLPRSVHVAPPITLTPALLSTSAPAQAVPLAAPEEETTSPARELPLAADSVAPAPVAATATDTSTLLGRALPLVAALWALVYVAGMTWALARLLRARSLWRRMMAAAERVSRAALQVHIAFTAEQRRQIAQRGLTVMRIDAAISPMLIGVLRPVLLLPAHLDGLTAEQQQMIVAHELHHWRARDPLCLAIAATLRTVFWFNPATRWMAKQMEWALELQCDQQVLNGRPQQQRKQYAASLLLQWTAPMGVAAFNGATITARIRQMQKNSLPALSAAAVWTTAAALMAVLAAGALLQPALAIGIPAATAQATAQAMAPAPAPAAEAWRAPLDEVRVTSFFGVRRSVPRTPHKGIDFRAAKGTPVYATASGTIIAAGPIAEGDGKYGNAVIIDHGPQHSLYAHLDSVSVQPGQRVQAGQLIGAVGETGLATGPHLHLEVRRNGQIIDPATMFTDLDAHATAHALKVRRQQLPSKG
ncbi:peptidoglycan DD-metalloendopeptidase family protein [Duganella sp. FT94W]|uniref:Peptidoglycan DD-metalloendopeptidase family protein n=1 Tax=Duganella lactea TaxID=2692173 RepID=A0ABW9V0F2_9BURK|nr:M23/M56 family metallopeptidase [Duganella lactea]MYM33231.1 peptidoglycan DD-metalloendopeptidase family protein [Duganella lactea]